MHKRLMFFTIGIGATVEDSIALAIQNYRPDHVVFFTTDGSREKVLPLVLAKLGWSLDSQTLFTVPTPAEFEDFDDVELLHIVYLRAMGQAFVAHNASSADAVVDFTSGTKAMSAALFSAAYEAGVEIINYVTGERSQGRVISGTGRMVTTRPRRLRARDSLREGLRLFNTGDYLAALHAANELAKVATPNLPHQGETRALLQTASAAFLAWDRFQIAEALEHLNALGTEHTELSGKALMGKKPREERKAHLYKIKNSPLCLERLAELVANAKRRDKHGNYDDALARLYRAIEYMAQLRLFEQFGLSTGEFPVDELPESMNKHVESGQQRCQLALQDSWKVLALRGDLCGQKFYELQERIKLLKALNARNNSILAHGFEPIDPVNLAVLREAIEELAIVGWGEERWHATLELCQFPKFKIDRMME
ncbi:MAG: TIGR02710 family CRISPR-associated protein [Bradymonadaceae bacterium]|nr:TIGR02710 family CRISPR-associated protein [Lujinxingiaceae bacterium]